MTTELERFVMDTTMRYETVGQIEMKPDLYAGKNADEVCPRWVCGVEKEGEVEIGDVATLAASTFPPGTKIQILVPACPKCKEANADWQTDDGKCGNCAGFDWSAWTNDQYS